MNDGNHEQVTAEQWQEREGGGVRGQTEGLAGGGELLPGGGHNQNTLIKCVFKCPSKLRDKK